MRKNSLNMGVMGKNRTREGADLTVLANSKTMRMGREKTMPKSSRNA